jgi:hypothetical protein
MKKTRLLLCLLGSCVLASSASAQVQAPPAPKASSIKVSPVRRNDSFASQLKSTLGRHKDAYSARNKELFSQITRDLHDMMGFSLAESSRVQDVLNDTRRELNRNPPQKLPGPSGQSEGPKRMPLPGGDPLKGHQGRTVKPFGNPEAPSPQGVLRSGGLTSQDATSGEGWQVQSRSDGSRIYYRNSYETASGQGSSLVLHREAVAEDANGGPIAIVEETYTSDSTVVSVQVTVFSDDYSTVEQYSFDYNSKTGESVPPKLPRGVFSIYPRDDAAGGGYCVPHTGLCFGKRYAPPTSDPNQPRPGSHVNPGDPSDGSSAVRVVPGTKLQPRDLEVNPPPNRDSARPQHDPSRFEKPDQVLPPPRR